MIRRDPTLIALSDNDVQDVRELLRRKAYEQQQLAASTLGAAAGSASVAGWSMPSDLMKEYRDFEAKRAVLGKLTKDERLGLP